MKNIIDENLSVRITGDTMDNISVSRIDRRVNTYLDEMYLADEDGEVLIDGEPVSFKAGDIIAIYSTWIRGNSGQLNPQTVVIPSTDQLAISLKKTIEKTINAPIKESILSCSDENNM